MKCLLCSDDKEYNESYFSRIHLKSHNLSPKDYYDMYFKKSTDGMCKKCNLDTKFISYSVGYRQYCSSKCSNSHTNVMEKKKLSYLDHYGVDHPLKNTDIKTKLMETNVKKYGVNWGLSNVDIQNAGKLTNISKYGVDNQFKRTEYLKTKVMDKYGVDSVSKVPAIRDKAKHTLYDLYGVFYPLQNIEFQKKNIDTLYANYGVLTPLNSHIISTKYKNTILSRYNVNHIMQSSIIKDKIQKSCIDKYGYYSPMKNTEISTKSTKTRRCNYWDIYIEKMKLKNLVSDINKEEYINIDITYTVTCKLCNNKFTSHEHNPQRITCGCLKVRSQEETQLVNYIKDELNISNIIQNKIFSDGGDRYELDIYLPDYNIGIEIDGLYWHSELYKPRLYHKHKTNFFNKLGINIIHVFDHEWKNKRDIVTSIIRSKINKTDKIYARNCSIKELNNDEIRSFLTDNHLQGYANASVKIGLIYNNSIVACMTFSKPRYSSKYEYELVRFCNKLNFLCIGGFSKLLSYFKKVYDPTNIISYCDLRYFDSHGYEKNGFDLIGISDPNYYYFKGSVIYNRIACQKHKLSKLLDIFDENKSESENMINNGFLRIYDCGNKVLLYSKSINSTI